MSNRETFQREVDQNYEAFNEMLPELLKTCPGKFVLLRNKQKIAVFDTAGDALTAGDMQFKDGIYSIQQVTSVEVDLGYFSHVVGQ